MEFCAPLWSGDLSIKNTRDLERVQKIAFKIILGPKFLSYEDALAELEEETLEERKIDLCKKFGPNSPLTTCFLQINLLLLLLLLLLLY